MSVTAIVLAAGEGKRMKSALPKVAHEILGTPVIRLVVESASAAGADRIVVVTGHQAEQVEALIPGHEFVRQDQQLGTGHAVQCVVEALGDLSGPVVILAGDVPLQRPETLRHLIDRQREADAACILLSTEFPDPTGYGRVVHGADGGVTGIVEHRDLTPDQLELRECNVGSYCFDGTLLSRYLNRLEADNDQAEYYLTDLVRMFVADGLTVEATVAGDWSEGLGINSRVQLAEATAVLQQCINERHMVEGVTIVAPGLTWIGPHVRLARDVVIEPMTFLMGETEVAEGAHLGPNTRVTDSRIAEGARVDASILERAQVGPYAKVGPNAYLRHGTVLHEGSKAGACVEIKNSTVGEGSKVPHLSYIGDASIGKDVNVGAGTITCNYDGVRKHRTVIDDGAFVGSDTMLVAPVRIGRGAVTGAASAISKDVPDGALGLERSEQRTFEGWAERRAAADQTDGPKGSGTDE